MTILGLSDSFITMNRLSPTRRDRNAFWLPISENIEDRDVKFKHYLHSSLQFVLWKFEIDISDSLETMRFSGT